MPVRLSRLELRIMEILWRLGRASVREVQEALPARQRPAYTTVQTTIYRLEGKGALKRTRKIGNAHVFEPVLSRAAAHRRVIDDLLALFGGRAQPLMAHLVETGRLTAEDLRAAELRLEQLERKGGR